MGSWAKIPMCDQEVAGGGGGQANGNGDQRILDDS